MEQPDTLTPSTEPKTEGEQKMEAIRADMAATSASLANKLEALQDKTLTTVEAAQEAVTQTVETVQETAEAARRALDLKHHTEQRPWMMVGLATLAGTVAGYVVSRVLADAPSISNGFSGPAPATPAPASHAAPATSDGPGLFDEEIRKVKEIAVGAGLALARDWLKDAIPQLAEQIDEFAKDVAPKLGGAPVESRMAEPPRDESRPNERVKNGRF